ncbi:MAG: helix-turn-helix transcriptional regulator [Clostridia bacterium]|nr:helix-turn-helix transcriptional regulator [Clostridia bacterium]
MKTFGEKLKERRNELGLSQNALAEMCGITGRSVYGYEAGEKIPKRSTVLKLSAALGISDKYLLDDSAENPADAADYISEAGRLYGEQGARDMKTLLEKNTALFAGGELSQSEKDTFFEAVMRAYIACKDEYNRRTGRTEERK